MKWELLTSRLVSKVELIAISVLQVLLIFSVATATLVLLFLFVRDLVTDTTKFGSIRDLLPAMQQTFAGILIVVLGLELLETLRTYFREAHVRVEVILAVAIIAIGRHVIQADLGHTPGISLLGEAALILALVVGYFLVKRTASTKGESVRNPEQVGERLTETTERPGRW